MAFLKWLGQATLVFAVAGAAGLALMGVLTGSPPLIAFAIVAMLGWYTRENARG